MMPSTNRDQAIALAGVIQAARAVHQLARQDTHDEAALWVLAESLFRTDATSAEEVFGSKYDIDPGLRTMVSLFSSKVDSIGRDVYQYSIAMQQLSIKLSKLERTGQVIQDGLLEIHENTGSDAELDREATYEALAALYSRTISYLTPRIIVQGESGRLQDQEIVNRVRTALFGGIRAAYLWHQLGGRRWHLLFIRGSYVSLSRELLSA